MTFLALADTADMKLTEGCALCEEITNALMAPYEKALSFYLSGVEDLLWTPNRRCVAHLELLVLLFNPTILDYFDTTILVHKFDDTYIRFMAEEWEAEGADYDIGSSPGFGLVNKASTGYARILDPQWIDRSLIQKWKKKLFRHKSLTVQAPSNREVPGQSFAKLVGRCRSEMYSFRWPE